MKSVVAFVMILFAGVPAARAACSIDQFLLRGVATSYDPFQNAAYPSIIALSARATGSCTSDLLQFAMTPSPTNPQTGPVVRLSSGAHALSASIEDASGTPRPVTTEGAAFTSTEVSLPLGRTGLQGPSPLKLVIQPGQAVPPGVYSAQLNVLWRVIDKTGSTIQGGRSLLLVSVRVIPSVWLAAGSDTLIDLGEIRPNEISTAVRFDAYSNVGYDLVLISDNRFQLRRGNRTQPGIDYMPYISGLPVVLPSRSDMSEAGRVISFQAPGNGARMQSFNVKILPFRDMPAGNYGDLVTLEIRART